MTEATIPKSEWLSKITEIVRRNTGASEDEREVIYAKVAKAWGPEASVEARRLFEPPPKPTPAELIKTLTQGGNPPAAPAAAFIRRRLFGAVPAAPAPARPRQPSALVAPRQSVAKPTPPPPKFSPSPQMAQILSRPALSIVPSAPQSQTAPGLLGEIADFITESAMYPSTKFALATGLGVMGALISQRIAGPSGPRGTGTHLYQAVVGPTGSGKEHVRTTGKLLLSAIAASGLIGPGRFKSGAGVVKYLKSHPVALCFLDELGAVFAMLADPRTAAHVRDVNEVLRELWGLSWGRYDSPAGAYDETETVMCPALSLLGMTTPKELYRACKSRDIANGFLNRFMFIEEKTAPEYRKVPEDALDVPAPLTRGLAKLYQPLAALDPTGKPPIRLAWGPGAEEIFDAVRQSVETNPDERQRELFWRSAEKTVRVATIVAAGCFSDTVTREAMEWARQWVLDSDATLLAGVTEYMEEEKLEFDELCKEIIRRIKYAEGEMTKRDLGRSFQGNVRFKADLDRALDHLVETEQLIRTAEPTGGRPSISYSIPEEE